MLKKLIKNFVIISIFLLPNIFIATNKAFASSSDIVIYQLQTTGATSGTASQEFILLYNSSMLPVDVTNWCIKYSSSSDNLGFSSCIESPDQMTRLMLQAGGFVSFATSQFIQANAGFTPDVTFTGGMSSTAGYLRLHDESSDIIDEVAWGTVANSQVDSVSAHPAGKVLSRDLLKNPIDSDSGSADFSSTSILTPIVSGLYEEQIIIDQCPNIIGEQAELPIGYLKDDLGDCYVDICLNLDGLQIDIPHGYYIEDVNCLLVPVENRPIIITEIYPNAPSYDTGFEFVELYNPNDTAVNLEGYIVEVGPSFSEKYVFTAMSISPGQYMSFSDVDTGIVLPNSSGVILRLVSPAGDIVSETEIYSNASEDMSWAIVEDTWIYTNQITKSEANKPYLEPILEEVLGVTTVLAPCPAGKYRNPDTNRCRSLETAISQLMPCDEDEYRNPETNRCRKIATATSASLSPCPEGQERNHETNRCRKIPTVTVSDAEELAEIEDVASLANAPATNWTIAGVSVGCSLSYIAYEWRRELTQRLRSIKRW